jgi:hypothetical protein
VLTSAAKQAADLLCWHKLSMVLAPIRNKLDPYWCIHRKIHPIICTSVVRYNLSRAEHKTNSINWQAKYLFSAQLDFRIFRQIIKK